MKRCNIALLAYAVTLLSGCDADRWLHPMRYEQIRRERLLTLYPPGTTRRSDVQARFDPLKPKLSEIRPPTGWEHCRDSYVGARSQASATRTGKAVTRCERYQAPDGVFSLCYCWFYYDEADRLVDAEWQWSSD